MEFVECALCDLYFSLILPSWVKGGDGEGRHILRVRIRIGNLKISRWGTFYM